jgi:hypothetical protein
MLVTLASPPFLQSDRVALLWSVILAPGGRRITGQPLQQLERAKHRVLLPAQKDFLPAPEARPLDAVYANLFRQRDATTVFRVKNLGRDHKEMLPVDASSIHISWLPPKEMRNLPAAGGVSAAATLRFTGGMIVMLY